MKPPPTGFAVAAGVGIAALALVSTAAGRERYVGRLLGFPVPASVREVRYRASDWLGLNPEPAYYLRFRADADDVRLLLQRGGFGPGEPSTLWLVSLSWWVPKGGGTGLMHYERAAKPRGCVVEHLWWDEGTGEVFYLRSCP